jgi:hypothetical protein
MFRSNVYLLVPVLAEPRGLVVLGAVDVRAVGEGSVPPSHRAPATLVLKVPVETRERTVLLALVLQKQGALLHAKLF